MVFSSLAFLCIFLPVCLILDRLFRDLRIKNAILLAASLIFYSYGEPVYVILMAGSALMNYIWALLLSRDNASPAARKGFLAASVITNLAALALFKYSAMMITSVNRITGASIRVPQIALPLGISFFTFQAMSYVIDVYRGDCRVQKNFGRLLLYISFFPQLIAGPIVKYRDIEEEIRDRSETRELTAKGIRRFGTGLAKKVLISNYVAAIADGIFNSAPGAAGTAGAWIGAIAYTLQIYYDFSGYSDMAIGLGYMFGFHFKENFDHPYIAMSVKDFWRRWHISLSSWFRDYLYIPLGGNRRGRGRTVLNKFIVFACTGIWHGANWTFLLWGLYHGTFLMIEEIFPKRKNRPASAKVLSHIYLLLVVIIGFVLFRCDTLTDCGHMLKTMFIPGAPTEAGRILTMSLLTPVNVTAMFAGIIFAMPLPGKLKQNRTVKAISYPAALLAVAFAVLSLSSGTYNPFIYFRF